MIKYDENMIPVEYILHIAENTAHKMASIPGTVAGKSGVKSRRYTMNKVYGVFYFAKTGEPILLREFRSYRAALIHNMEMCEQTDDWNFIIMERDLSEWRPVHGVE